MSVSGQYLLIIGQDGARVRGESAGKGEYRRSIDIKGWDWGVTDQSSTAAGKASGKGVTHSPGKSGAATIDEKGLLPDLFKFTKGVDTSTTRLMQAMDNNERMKSAKFVLHEELAEGANDGHKAFLLEVILEDVYVVGYSLQGRAAEARVDLDESWEFHYKTVRIDYVSARGRPSSSGYTTVNFERKPGAERGTSGKAAPDVNAKIEKMSALVEKMRREKTQSTRER